MDKKGKSVCPLCGQPGFHGPCEIQIGDVRELLQKMATIQERLRGLFGTTSRREALDKAVALVAVRGSKFNVG